MSPLGNKKIILYLKNRSGSTIFQQHKRATRLLSKIQVGGIRGQIFRTLMKTTLQWLSNVVSGAHFSLDWTENHHTKWAKRVIISYLPTHYQLWVLSKKENTFKFINGCILLGKVRVTSQEARGALRVSAEPTVIASPGQDGGIEAVSLWGFYISSYSRNCRFVWFENCFQLIS